MSNWFVYLIEAQNGHFYCGATTDPKRRLQQHANYEGARFFNRTAPNEIVFLAGVSSRSEAQTVEAFIKRKSRTWKQSLVFRRSFYFGATSLPMLRLEREGGPVAPK